MEHTSPFEFTDDRFDELSARAIELAQLALNSERKDPVLPVVRGPDLRQLIDEPLPKYPTDPAALFEIIERVVIPNSRRNGHQRFFGYVSSSADPLGVLADLVASALNQNVTAWRSAPIAAELERLVIRWLDEFVGFGGGGNGLLVSGGSSANSAAMTCAIMEAQRGDDGPSRDRMTIYVSREGHLSLRKAARLLGIASAHIREINVDAEFRMDIDALVSAIEADHAAGLVPVCVCASAGTTNTGAVDPLDVIAKVCHDRSVWFHVDGAYGAPAASTDTYAWMRAGISRADSLSLDPHKWLFAPLDVGCVLIRDQEAARRTFTEDADYTSVSQTAPIERYAFFDHGPELSRRFRALKVWMILKARGADAIASEIARHIAMRERLDERVEREALLEFLGSGLSVCCFRFVPEGVNTDVQIDQINQAILEQIVREGHVFMSPTLVNRRFALRVCIVSYRTQQRDINFLLDEVLRVGPAVAPSSQQSKP